MGHNLDLCQILGLPEKIVCPRCRQQSWTYFDDYDVDCGRPIIEVGKWKLNFGCSECGYLDDLLCEVKLEMKWKNYKSKE